MTISPVDHVILLMWAEVSEDGERPSEENIIKRASSAKYKHDQKAECTQGVYPRPRHAGKGSQLEFLSDKVTIFAFLPNPYLSYLNYSHLRNFLEMSRYGPITCESPCFLILLSHKTSPDSSLCHAA